MAEPFDTAIAHHDDVESHSAAAQFRVLIEEQGGGESDPPLLGGRGAGSGAAETVIGARTYLDDHQQITLARDHIELSDTAEEIPRDDLKPLGFEKGGRAVLGERSCLTAIHAV